MSYSNEWLQFRESEEEYFDRRYAFMQDEEKMIGDLKMALSLVDDNETALRFLLEVSPNTNIILSLIPRLVTLSVDSSNLNIIKLARDILHIYKDDPLVRINIQNSTTSYLAYNDDWHYRRVAELYKLLGYKEELTSFVLLCQTNNNLEIREISDDFYSVQD